VPCLLLGLALSEGCPSSMAGGQADEPPQKPRFSVEQAVEDRPALLKQFDEEFVLIAPGSGEFPMTFQMGSSEGLPSEGPVREVTLSHSFSMARYEVPQNLYAAVMKRNPSAWHGARNSVEMVSWNEAARFCFEVTRLMRAEGIIGPEMEIRLPTEAEWEYCCRAGSTTIYSFGPKATGPTDDGNSATILDEYGWHTGNAAGNDPPVGAKKPNAWGLYDMHGYLWEFVADRWHDRYDGAPLDARAWEAAPPGTPRVIRGGSWRDHFQQLRSAARWPIPDHARSDAIGFRCVKARVADGGSQ